MLCQQAVHQRAAGGVEIAQRLAGGIFAKDVEETLAVAEVDVEAGGIGHGVVVVRVSAA